MVPTIIDIPSQYHRQRPRAVDLLVVHAMAEWVKDDEGVYHYCTDWLNVLKLSVHGFCLPDGRIVQSVDPERVAYHAGNDNNRSIGMEFIVAGGHNYSTFLKRMANETDPPYTQAQYEAGGWWYRKQAERFGLTFDQIKPHSELDPARKKDPGAAFDWETFRAAFEAAGQ
jgi:N-acetyl-anhydromuramyl-L-alanine amidase AmpD